MCSPSWCIDLHRYKMCPAKSKLVSWIIIHHVYQCWSQVFFFSPWPYAFIHWPDVKQAVWSRTNFSTLRHSNTRHVSITVNKLQGNRTDLWCMVEQKVLRLVLWQNALGQSLHYTSLTVNIIMGCDFYSCNKILKSQTPWLCFMDPTLRPAGVEDRILLSI